jgi:uncharacterized protein YecT (DUF1311 family)
LVEARIILVRHLPLAEEHGTGSASSAGEDLMRLAIAIGASALSAYAAQAQVPNPIDCNTASTTVELNYCTERTYQKADEKLNEAYQAVLKQIRASGGEAPYDAKSWEEALRVSQRAWIVYRDAECKGLVPMEWSGGTGTAAAVNGCMTELTEARTKVLTERDSGR